MTSLLNNSVTMTLNKLLTEGQYKIQKSFKKNTKNSFKLTAKISVD